MVNPEQYQLLEKLKTCKCFVKICDNDKYEEYNHKIYYLYNISG